MASAQAHGSTDLWDKALKALDPKYLQQISDFQCDPKKVLSEVLKEAQAKRDTAFGKRWTYKKSDGSVVILRDVFEKVVHWVSKYAQAVDVVANADPIHVGLPWAVVRFLLQTFTSDVQAFGCLSEGIEVIAGVLTHCVILEKLYLSPSSLVASDESMHLSQCIVKVYTNLSVYLAKAKKFWSKNTVQRMTKALFEGMEAKHHKLQLDISKADEEVHRAASSVRYQKLIGESDETRKRLTNLFKDIREPLLRTAQKISDIHDQLNQEKRREILHWLSTVPCESHHQEARKKLLEGTGTWLLKHPALREWQSSSVSAFFWLHGIPGAGKSSLTSFLIQTFLEQHKAAATQPPLLAFFYSSSKGADAKRSSPEEILLSILRQLTGRDSKLSLRGSVVREFRRRKEEADEIGTKISRLDKDEIVAHILDITADNPVIIIIDALDEVDDVERGDLLDALEKLVRQSQNLTKIFVSSRNDEDIADRFKRCLNICINECLSHEDIKNFVKYKIEQAIKTQKLLRGKVSSHLRDEIVSTLTAKAQGMFRWVELSIETLSNSRRMSVAKDVRSELGKLPAELKEQYAIIYKDILDSAQSTALIARKAFSWILAAQRVLTVEELIAAVALDNDGFYHEDLDVSRLLHICRNLIIETSVDDNSTERSFQFAHLSVKEFLEELPEYSCEKIHTIAVSRCLHNFDSNLWLKVGPAYRQLLHGYSIYLFEHAERSDLTRLDSTIAREMTDFLGYHQYKPTLMLEEWFGLIGDFLENYILPQDTKNLSLYERRESHYRHIYNEGLEEAAISLVYESGLLSVLKVLDDDDNMALRSHFTENFHSILRDLIISGQLKIIKFLLEIKLLDPALIRENSGYLWWAVRWGQEGITGLFLELGADPLGNSMMPLIGAFNGENLILLKQLVERAELVHEKKPGKQSWKADALTEALDVGWTPAAVYLLGRDADSFHVSSQKHNRTTLQLAVSNAQRTVIKDLLEKSLPYSPGRTSIPGDPNRNSKAHQQHINAVDNSGRTALHYLMDRDYPASEQNEEIMKMLVEYEADLTVICDDGLTVLHVAASIGSIEMVHLLIQKGSDIQATTAAGANALHLAAGGSCLSPSIIQYLTGKGLNPLARDQSGRTPLHYAATACNLHMIIALLEILSGDLDWTWYRATKSALGHIDTQGSCTASPEMNNVEELVDIVDNQGKSMLHVVGKKHDEIPDCEGERLVIHIKDTVRFLCNLGANINKTSSEGMTPLCFQCSGLHSYYKNAVADTVASELLAHGADPNLPDHNGRTPLHHAVENGTDPAVELLLGNGANVNAADHDLVTPLHLGSISLNNKIFLRLLSANANHEARDYQGATPLHRAAQKRYNSQIIQMLIKKGANVHSKDRSGATPLHFATIDCDSFHMISVFLRHGADIKAVTQSGETPLHWAAKYGSSSTIIRTLIEYGSDPKAVTLSGETPLHYAAMGGNSDAINVLLESGSDPEAVDVDDANALQYVAK